MGMVDGRLRKEGPPMRVGIIAAVALALALVAASQCCLHDGGGRHRAWRRLDRSCQATTFLRNSRH